MWLLHFIPDGIIHLVVFGTLASGLILYVLSMFITFVPPALPYKAPISFFATVLIVLGVYGYGTYDNEMSWRARAAELQAKIDISEEKAKAANLLLSNEIAKRNQLIKDSQAEIKARIKKDAEQINAKCIVSTDAITILNDAAKSTKVKK